MPIRTIVLVDINQFFGGGQVYGLQLAQMLMHDYDLRVMSVNKRFSDELKQLHVQVIDLSGLLRWGRISHQLLITVLCIWLRLTGKADLVWLNGIPEIVVTPFCRLLGCKVAVTRHLDLQLEPQSKLKLLFRVASEIAFRWIAPLTNKVVCVSDAVRAAMATILPPSKLEVIHNWVSTLPPQVEISERNPEVCRLLFVGRVQPHKGPFEIIKAMKLLVADAGAPKVSLTIVGQGAAREALEEAAQGLDVHFMGFQQDPSQFYRNTDVFLNPSFGPEGLPLVTLDAMSHGLPCILSDLPVHVEVSQGGEAALLFRIGDAVDLADKIRAYAKSDALRKQYGESARKAIEATFVLPVAREKYLRVIHSL